jgi:transposase
MLGISKQAVWLWVGQYNRNGPEGLVRQGRGGRRWSLLSWSQEEALLKSFEKRALEGEVITAKQMLPKICQATGGEVSLAYVYRLLRRHQWRKLGPRPRHVKADPEAQEEFKKNSRSSSKKS